MAKIIKSYLSTWTVVALLAGSLPGVVAYAAADSCCKPGAACCFPGSPCCAGHQHSRAH
jgi:hypothetical protein